MRKLIGISQKIRRVWLDALLDQVAKTTDEAELRHFLDDELKRDLPGKESRAKAAGIVLRIWGRVPPERVPLRSRALAMLPRIPGQQRMWLHWGMTALAYPFFRDTAEVAGRLLALQDDFTTSQVRDRMLTTWGDRDTNKEAVQKLITTLVDWEVLRGTKASGHFLLARKMTASIPELELWLLEALLGASASDEVEARQLLRLPEAFPFALTVAAADLRRHAAFDLHRQGLDMDMVALRKVRHEPLPRSEKKAAKRAPARVDGPTLFDVQPEGAPPGLGAGRAERVAGPQAEAVAPPAAPFVAASSECALLLREGRHLACISLTAAVIEAVVRHLYRATTRAKVTRGETFEKSLEALHKKNLIKTDWKTELQSMRANNTVSRLLSPWPQSGGQDLEAAARQALGLLNDLEGEFFAAAVRDGALGPRSRGPS